MRRRAAVLAVLALAAAGCGSHRRAEPKLSPKVGAALLAQAKRIETLLDERRTCVAAGAAASLQGETIALINRGLVQAELQEPLLSKVNSVAGTALCVPGAPPPPPARARARALRRWLRAHSLRRG
jgi:hypothetical protein